MIALLHGFAGTPAAWDDVRAALPGGARAIALPGHAGESGDVRPTWDDNLAAVARAIGPSCDTVVGYSLGARVALGLVVAGLVRRAVLIGVNPGIDDAERAARVASDAQWAALLRAHGTAAFADAWAAQPLFASQARVPAERVAARRAARLALDPEQLARSLEVMGLGAMPDYRGEIVAHAGALSLIAGADDAKYVAIARELGLPLTTIADSGHDPTLEQPIALAASISAWSLVERDRAVLGPTDPQ